MTDTEQVVTDSLQKRVINKTMILVAVAQPLGTVPQIIILYGRRNATSLSIVSWLLYILFDLMWLWYGITNKQRAVYVSAALYLILEAIVATGAIMYGGKW